MPIDFAQQAIDRITDEIADVKRRLLNSTTNPGAQYQLRGQLGELEEKLENQHAANKAAKAEKAARAQEIADKETERQAAFEADLKVRFRRVAPYGTEDDFQAMRPQLLSQIADDKRARDERERARYPFIPDNAVVID